jgi:hypothetical protein
VVSCQKVGGVETGFAGRMKKFGYGEDFGDDTGMRRGRISPVRGGLDVIKPTLSGRIQAPHKFFLQVNDLAKVVTHAEMEIPQNPRKIEELGHQGFKTCHFSGLMR